MVATTALKTTLPGGLPIPTGAPPARPAPPSVKLDLKAASVGRFLGGPVPKIPWLLEGILPLGMPAALAAAPGTGKSFWLIMAGMAVATGVDFLPGFKVAAPGKALLVFAEESEVVLHRRFADLSETLIAEREDAVEIIQRLKQNLFIMAREGEDNRLIRPGERRGEVEETPFATGFRELLASPELEGLRLLGLDPWSQLAPNAETDAAESTAAVSLLTSLAKNTGAAVIVAVHVRKKNTSTSRKASTLDLTDAEEIRGSSAFLAAVRTAIALAPVQQHEAEKLAANPSKPHDTLLCRVSKSNHGGSRAPFLMRRQEGGCLNYWRDLDDGDVVSDAEADMLALGEIRAILRTEAEKPGGGIKWTEREFARTHKKNVHWHGKPLSENGLRGLLSRLRASGDLQVTEDRNPKLMLPQDDAVRAEPFGPAESKADGEPHA